MTERFERGTPPAERSRGSRWGVGILAGGLSVALLATWLVPGNAPQAQNRPPVEFPGFSLSSLARAGWYAQIDAALRDRLGAQVLVSESFANLAVHGIGRSPSPQVYLGADGQPFFAQDFVTPCLANEDSLVAIKDDLTTNASEFKRAGIEILYIVAPDKSSVRRTAVEAHSSDLLRCSDRVRAAFEAWEASGDLPLITLWNRVEALDSVDDPAFLFDDTHWNGRGATSLTTALLEYLVAQGEVDGEILRDAREPQLQDPVTYFGDLNTIMGINEGAQQQRVTFTRSGVSTTELPREAGSREQHHRSTSTDAPLVPGRTLILGDSFLLSQLPSQLPGFFEDLTMAHLDDPFPEGDYDRIIVERVQRHLTLAGWLPRVPTADQAE